MGVAIADALAEKGALVTLVLGPSMQNAHHTHVSTVHVESAHEMYEVCKAAYKDAAIAVLAAAVADFKPTVQASDKIKKKDNDLTVVLTQTEDILADLGKIKQHGQTLVGFALETSNELEHAREKLVKKNADVIVLNSLQDKGAGFGYDTNKITLLSRDGTEVILPLQSKTDAAIAIVNHILELRHAEKTA